MINFDCQKLFAITAGAGSIGRFLKNSSLQVLDIGGNPISDDGISLMIEGLQCNKTLTKLDMIKCGLSAKGTTYTLVGGRCGQSAKRFTIH